MQVVVAQAMLVVVLDMLGAAHPIMVVIKATVPSELMKPAFSLLARTDLLRVLVS